MGHQPPPQPGSTSPSDREITAGDSTRTTWPPRICPRDVDPNGSDRFPGTLAPALISPPFVWHDGPRVFIFGVEPVGWVTAELRFDQTHLAYVEVHRAIYHWPREAVGAFLARACGASLPSMCALLAALDRWATSRHVQTGPPVA